MNGRLLLPGEHQTGIRRRPGWAESGLEFVVWLVWSGGWGSAAARGHSGGLASAGRAKQLGAV